MKRISLKRISGLFLVACLLAFTPALFSSAAAKPGFVKDVKATNVTGTKATLTWSQAKNATGYNVYRVDPETSDIIGTKPVVSTRSLSCTVTIKTGKMYSFQVYAYRQDGKKQVENEEGSPPVDVEAQLLQLSCYGNGCVYLEWDKVKKAEGYILYKLEDGEYKQIKKTTKTNCKVKIPIGETYKLMLRSYRNKNGEKVLSQDSNVLKLTGKKLESVHGRLWKTWLKQTLRVKNVETGKKVTLKAGTKVLAPGHSYANLKVVSPNGKKTYWIKGKYLRFGELALAPSYDYYNKIQAETFVNKKKYTSKTDYLIWISQYTASVHFFKKNAQGKWKETRVAKCIIGGPNGHTLVGEYETFMMNGMIHFFWNPDKEWGQAFHGWIDGNRWGSYSKGCVRLESYDVKYLKSLPLGTKVVSY